MGPDLEINYFYLFLTFFLVFAKRLFCCRRICYGTGTRLANRIKGKVGQQNC